MFLADIILAINMASPQMNPISTKWYAKIINHESVKWGVDPLIIVSVITHESHWNSSLISFDQKDFGLMQIRSKYFSSIPENHLLNPATNIQIGTALLRSNYNFCEKFLGREPLYQEYGSCYAGLCRTKSKTCKPSKIADTVEKYARCLEDSIIEGISKDCRPWYNYGVN